jgi:hypothetical protein
VRVLNKKGVQIPITMVIMLIIAIITLGLIIGFIQSFFGETSSIVSDQLAKVKQELRNDLEQGRQLFVTDFGRKLEANQGETKVAAFGLKNSFGQGDEDGSTSVCYAMEVRCVKSFDLQGECTPNQQFDALVGGVDSDTGEGPLSEDRWVSSIEQGGYIDVLDNEVQVGEITFQVPAAKGSYTTEIVVKRSQSNLDCGQTSNFDPFQTYRFTTVVG